VYRKKLAVHSVSVFTTFKGCPLDFLLWGFVKDKVYFQPLPANVGDLRARITFSVTEVTPNMLHRTWEILIMGGIFVLLHLEVTSNCTSDASDKT
jgi:hypothetical protein